MSLIRINRTPSAGDLRVFATLWLVVFGGVSLAAAGRGWEVAAWVAGGASVVVGLTGWIRPHAVRMVYLVACFAAAPVGFVVSHLLLAAIYFLVLTPVALLMRLARKDPLERRFDPRRSTYWTTREPARPPESYFRQH
jgi:hypothetical protein